VARRGAEPEERAACGKGHAGLPREEGQQTVCGASARGHVLGKLECCCGVGQQGSRTSQINSQGGHESVRVLCEWECGNAAGFVSDIRGTSALYPMSATLSLSAGGVSSFCTL
jgi:hypothetical protein